MTIFTADSTPTAKRGETTTINGTSSMIMGGDAGQMFMDIITADEILDNDACDTEPVSGTNTITNGIDTLVHI